MSTEQGDVEVIREALDCRTEVGMMEARVALDRLAAALERAERDFAIKDRAMTDYFADASRRADEWQARAEKAERALAEKEQAWEDMRAYNIRLEERAREAERALAEIIDELGVPGENYAAPVANAAKIARAALLPSEDTSDES